MCQDLSTTKPRIKAILINHCSHFTGLICWSQLYTHVSYKNGEERTPKPRGTVCIGPIYLFFSLPNCPISNFVLDLSPASLGHITSSLSETNKPRRSILHKSEKCHFFDDFSACLMVNNGLKASA